MAPKTKIVKRDFNALFADPILNKNRIGEGVMTMARIIVSGTKIPDRFRDDAEMDVFSEMWRVLPKIKPGNEPFSYLFRVGQRRSWRFAEKETKNSNRAQTNAMNESGDAVTTCESGDEIVQRSIAYADLPSPAVSASRRPPINSKEIVFDALSRVTREMRRIDDEDPRREFLAGMLAMARLLSRRIDPSPARPKPQTVETLEADELASIADELLDAA